MRGWDWIFALFHPGLYIMWLDYRELRWVCKRPAKRFRHWAEQKIREEREFYRRYVDEEN